MKTTLIAAKPMTYATRRLLPGDSFDAKPADARVLIAIGKAREPRPAAPLPNPGSVAEDAARKSLRRDYEAKFGRKPFQGWDSAELKKRLASEA